MPTSTSNVRRCRQCSIVRPFIATRHTDYVLRSAPWSPIARDLRLRAKCELAHFWGSEGWCRVRDANGRIFFGWWIVLSFFVLNVYWAGTLISGLTVFF